jgi:hypothetical protein
MAKSPTSALPSSAIMVPLDAAPIHGSRPRLPHWGLGTSIGVLVLVACLATHACGARGQDGPKEVRFDPGRPPEATRGYLSHDSRLLAIPGSMDRIELWHLATGRRDELRTAPARPGIPINEVTVQSPPLPVVVFASDGRHLAALYDESVPNPARISWWDLEARTETVVATLLRPQKGGIQIGVSRDDSLLTALVSAEARPRDGHGDREVNTLHLWRLPGGKQVVAKQLKCRGYVTNLSPDGRFALVRVGEGSPIAFEGMLLELDGEKVLWSKVVGADAAFTADGRSVLSRIERRVLLADVATGAERCLLELTPEQVQGGGVFLSISPDRRLLAVCSYPSPVVTVYDTATGREVGRFRFAAEELLPASIGFSPDGRYILTTTGHSGKRDEAQTPELRLWQVPEKWRHLDQ